MADISDVICPAAVRADQPAGEWTVRPFSSIAIPGRIPLADLLHPLKLLPANDCGMMVPYQILRHLTLIFPALMGQKIRGIGLLQECVPAIPFQGDHPGDHRGRPPGLYSFLYGSPSPDLPLGFSLVMRRDVFIIQPSSDVRIPLPVLHFLKDPPDDSCFLLYKLHASDLIPILHHLKCVLSFRIAITIDVVIPYLTLGITFLVSPADVG